MTLWQRRARLLIGSAAVVFAVFVAYEFKRRAPAAPAPAVPRTDPAAVVESTGGRIERFQLSRENASIAFEKHFTYPDGSSKLLGVSIATDERNSDGPFTATAKEASVGKDESTVVLNGDVRVASAAIHARTGHATFAKGENTLRAPGPTEIAEGKTSASGVGMTFDRNADVLTIHDQAVIHMADENGGTCGTAIFARRDRYRRFEKDVRMRRGPHALEADLALAYLSADEKRIERIELRENARIIASDAAAGALQSLTGRIISLTYAADGASLEHATIDENAVIQVAGEKGQPGRQIAARLLDITMGPDGSTPVAVVGRENVQLTMPAEGDAPARTIQAVNLDAKGQPGRGLTRALFSGNVEYRERGANSGRAASSGTLDVGLKPAMSAIEDARFAHAVKFEEGKLAALAAAARYDVDKGTLELSGSEPRFMAPHVINEQITVDAQKIDVTLEGPKVKAAGNVKSVLQPNKNGRVPSMLKQDQPVNVLAANLDYDGAASRGTYTGDARLFQGDTSVKAETISIDDKNGDLSASGGVTSTTMLEQQDKDKKKKKKERVRSLASSKDMKYEEADRRLTYTGSAHMTNPDGDMTAARIELYLKPSGDELDRAEAYDEVTLREQERKTTGSRMTYTADDERYVITGAPVKIVDECSRETIGRTLTFLKATDSIVVDGNQQIRTQTKGGGKCAS
jgi:lipopolysaccharide transport protein LptA